MAYIGSNPVTQSFISGTDYFNGDGTTVAFTLSRSVNSVNDIEVLVNNVEQQPNTVYTVLGTTLTFTTAPSSGTQNIYVRYLSTTTQSIVPSQGTVNSAQLGLITTIPTTGGNTITLPASTGTVLTTASTGTVLQVINADLNTFFSTTSTIPLDDTIPQNTEGAEILTCAITPKFATSKLIIDVVMNVANNVATDISMIALFQDSTANALRAAWSRTIAANNPVSPMVIKHYMTAGTTSLTTFKVRGGGSTGNAGTFQINGGSGTRYLGGALISSITITEVAA